MKRSEVLFGLLRIPLDALAVMAALLLSYRLREASMDLIPRIQFLEPPSTLPPVEFFFDSFVLPGVGLFLIIAACLRLYALRSTRSAWVEIGDIIIAGALWLVAVVGWYFLEGTTVLAWTGAILPVGNADISHSICAWLPPVSSK